MKTQTFGVEIEMNNITRGQAAQVVAATLGNGATAYHKGGTYDAWEVTAADGRKWKLVSDASIDGPWEERTEFVTPICRWEDIETVQALVRALRAAGARAHSSCGIHVHIGLGEHTAKTLRNLVNLVNAKEDLLTAALQIASAENPCGMTRDRSSPRAMTDSSRPRMPNQALSMTGSVMARSPMV